MTVRPTMKGKDELKKTIDAFKQAILIRPDDADAHHGGRFSRKSHGIGCTYRKGQPWPLPNHQFFIRWALPGKGYDFADFY